jgi:hypothetical protein
VCEFGTLPLIPISMYFLLPDTNRFHVRPDPVSLDTIFKLKYI